MYEREIEKTYRHLPAWTTSSLPRGPPELGILPWRRCCTTSCCCGPLTGRATSLPEHWCWWCCSPWAQDCSGVCSSICSVTAGRLPSISIAATALWTVLVCVEYCRRSYFKSYFALSFIGNMASDVVGGFGDTVLPDVVLPRLPFILLAFVPLALCILLRRRIVTEQRMGRWSLLFLLVMCLLFGGIGSGLARWGTYHDAYTYNFTTDTGVTHFGLNASVRLEITYAIFGHPSPRLPGTGTKHRCAG
ncbi:MAG: hypothetical protein ACLUS6_17010 [Dysosmobacter sp.]